MTGFECHHPEIEKTRYVCEHLLEYPAAARYYRFHEDFKGHSLQYALVCEVCSKAVETIDASLIAICDTCFTDIQKRGYWVGIARPPEILERASGLSFTHRTLVLPVWLHETLVDIQPLAHLSQSVWIALTQSGRLLRLKLGDSLEAHDITTLSTEQLQTLTTPLGDSEPLTMALHVAPNGEMAVVYSPNGDNGFVIDLASGQLLMTLQRDGYHSDISSFPVAFFLYDGRLLLIHSSQWNRLDIYDPWTGVVLTERELPTYEPGKPTPPRYLDYFHGSLSISPDNIWSTDSGWVWQPEGILIAWRLDRWLENPWETEDGDSPKGLIYRDWWLPLCWVSNHIVATWGYGEYPWTLPAVWLLDVTAGLPVRWFPGPDVSSQPNQVASEPSQELRDPLVFDVYLFSISEIKGIQVWDIETGARLHHDPSFSPIRYHRGTKEFLSRLPNGDFQLSQLTNNVSRS